MHSYTFMHIHIYPPPTPHPHTHPHTHTYVHTHLHLQNLPPCTHTFTPTSPPCPPPPPPTHTHRHTVKVMSLESGSPSLGWGRVFSLFGKHVTADSDYDCLVTAGSKLRLSKISLSISILFSLFADLALVALHRSRLQRDSAIQRRLRRRWDEPSPSPVAGGAGRDSRAGLRLQDVGDAAVQPPGHGHSAGYTHWCRQNDTAGHFSGKGEIGLVGLMGDYFPSYLIWVTLSRVGDRKCGITVTPSQRNWRDLFCSYC